MGRLCEDFVHIFRALGGKNALKYVLFPRLLSHLHIKNFSQNKLCAIFFEENFPDILSKWQNVTLCYNDIVIPNRIWVFWWQGVEQMPFVISKCYQSILFHANGREVIALDKGNYRNYVDIPSFILRKFESGKISITHFSDIIRVLLLQKYGGIWIDAAIYVTRPIPNVDTLFYSPKLSHISSEAPHMNLWVMGVMGGPSQMPLFSYISEVLMCYWKKYDGVLTYLMFDYIIRYAYENFTWVKELIDNRKIESPNLHESRYTFNQEVNEQKLEVLLSNNTFFSLTYRVPYSLLSENGKRTYFSALLDVNDKRINNEKDKNLGGVILPSVIYSKPRLNSNQWQRNLLSRLVVLRYRFRQWRDKEATSFLRQLQLMSIDETVDYIIRNKCSCTRYGDGEFLVINGKGNSFQTDDARLADRLVEVLNNPVEGLLVCLPSFLTDVTPFVLNSQLFGLGFNHCWLKSAVMPYVPTNILYGDSLFTRFYMNRKDKRWVKGYIPKLKKLWHGEHLLIVEGAFSRLGVGNDLFDNALSIKRILCPNKNAFDKYDQIYDCVRRNHKGELIILAIGMTATILSYDLCRDGYRVLDLGHIDVEYEWYKMGAKEKVPIPHKQVSEVVDGFCIDKSNDSVYNRQIIADCS